jgi:hypothetical protein
MVVACSCLRRTPQGWLHGLHALLAEATGAATQMLNQGDSGMAPDEAVTSPPWPCAQGWVRGACTLSRVEARLANAVTTQKGVAAMGKPLCCRCGHAPRVVAQLAHAFLSRVKASLTGAEDRPGGRRRQVLLAAKWLARGHQVLSGWGGTGRPACELHEPEVTACAFAGQGQRCTRVQALVCAEFSLAL